MRPSRPGGYTVLDGDADSPQQRKEERMVTATRTDIDIQRDVLEEFEWDPQVEPTDAGVEVSDGVVTLTGVVDSYAMKVAAERAAHRVLGVRAVANDLSVRTRATWNDTDIAKAAASAIAANASLPANAISIDVNNGHVTLTGEVDWNYQRAAAGGTVRYLRGVRDLVNLITIKQPTVSPAEVKTGIERALVRAAEVDASRIHVRAINGHVTLTGTARSWAEKQAASHAAWNAKGVTGVTNEVEVAPI
jgi:osmotically-inducible protein OsmY